MENNLENQNYIKNLKPSGIVKNSELEELGIQTTLEGSKIKIIRTDLD